MGIYHVGQKTTTNYPYADGNGLLLVFAKDTNSLVQIFVRFDGYTYIRICWWNHWQPWESLTA